MSLSCADEEGCFTFTWEIENFDIFQLRHDQLVSPEWKTYSTDGSEVRWHAFACKWYDGDGLSTIRFRLICSHKTWKPDRWEASAISSCGKILPTSIQDSCSFVAFEIYERYLFSYEILSKIPLNTLTVECKMWSNSKKNGGFRIHSVVKKVFFCWCLDNPLFYSPISSPYSHDKIVEKDNIRIKMFLDCKGVNDQCMIRALALPITDGCFSFVYCNVVCDYIRESTNIEHENTFNTLHTKYKRGCRIVKQREVTLNPSCKFNLQLDIIVAHHNNQLVDISEAVNDPLSKDLLQLYRESILSDATLNTEGKSFSAHRSILAARSPVFRAMFEKDEMREGRSGVVGIDDVDSETVDRMLVFMYGGKLGKVNWDEATALFYAADKYDVQPLKQKCSDLLKAALTVDNACDALVFADMHSDEHLMNRAVDFIDDHQEVVSSPKFEQLEDTKPRLASKVTKKLFLKRRKK